MLAWLTAFLMVFSSFASFASFAPLPVFADEPVELSNGFDEVVYTRAVNETPRFFQSDYAVGDEDGLFLPPEITPFFIGEPQRAPTFSARGGVHTSAFPLSIHGYGANVRITFDGSYPVVCGVYPNCDPVNRNLPTNFLALPGYPHIAATCGCSFVLPAGETMMINYVVPTHANSPMSVHGIGRGNPGFWNVGWASGTIEDSGYVSPVLSRFRAFPNNANFTISNPAPPAAGGGYFVPNLIYNGIAIRAAGFDRNGIAGPASTQTFIVNRGGGLGWDDTRIISIVVQPEEFAHPITGMMRNWDRQLRRRSGPPPASPGGAVVPGAPEPFSDWVSRGAPPGYAAPAIGPHLGVAAQPARPLPAGFTRPVFWPAGRTTNWPIEGAGFYPYDWPAQIQAGLWDGLDFLGNPVPGMEDGGYFGLGSVRRRPDGVAIDMGYQNLGPRAVANIEVYDESGREIVNQRGRTWVFGNWSRFFPIRSIRINFNQGDGDVTGAYDLVPGTRRHFYAANELVTNFRHINLRTADIEGTNLRDPLSMWLAHPLRPMIQHATYSAVFVNGEFWGMYNMSVHRHPHFIGEMYGVPRNNVHLAQDEWMDIIANRFIIYPPSDTGGIAGREIDATTGTRRTALGTPNDAYEGGWSGYARRVPAYFPPNHPQAGEPVPDGWAGQDHLSREWFDYLDTVLCMDNFIDWFIVYYHLENWDWLNNNAEMWRTSRNLGSDPITGEDIFGDPVVIPGMYGADGRWRFIAQDFDNAIFHGANNMLNYFTAMTSPYCPEGCANCGNATPDDSRPANDCRGEPLPGGLPFDIMRDNSTWRRPEASARIFRVLLQNPYFRESFAARYSTYTGTAFHPARVERIISEQVDTRLSTVGRDRQRWGLTEGNPFMVPWASNNPYPFTEADRATRAAQWEGTSGSRWQPHTLRAPAGGSADLGGGSNPPPMSMLRGQQDVLIHRAGTAGPGDASGIHNSIEHMRAYFSMAPGNNPRPAQRAIGSWGRENQGLSVGTAGQYVRVNWRIEGGSPEENLAGDIGWLNVAGANVRADLFEWGNLSSYNRTVAGFPGFAIGDFSARYVRNMPIPVTANAQPGQRFSHFTVSGAGARIYVGGSIGPDGQNITDYTASFIPGQQIPFDTIRIIPAATEVTVTAHFNENEPTAIIHQVYGQGPEGNNAVSHGFIELYNPGPGDANLSNRTLQIQNIGDNVANNTVPTDWEYLEFPVGTIIPANTSFLIVSGAWSNTGGGSHVPRLIIEDYDMVWPGVEFSNRNFTVALVENPAGGGPVPLSRIITPDEQVRIDDLVGVVNSPAPRDVVHNVWGPSPASRISRQEASRRVWEFDELGNAIPHTVANTRNNYLDFDAVRFADLNMAEIELFRPRSSHDGVWPVPVGPTQSVVILNGGDGYRAFHNPAAAGQIVALEPGTAPFGHTFEEWTTITPNITIINPTSLTDAFFVMPTPLPGNPVTVTANFVEQELRPSSILINQVHGQGPPGDNTLSHGFIELHNPTSSVISLEGLSLQMQRPCRDHGEDIWHVLPLSNPIISPEGMRPGSSFLIVSTDWYNDGTGARPVPRYVIPHGEWDMEWNLRFSNRALTVALVEGTMPLSPIVARDEWSLIFDLVTAINDNSDLPAVLNFLGEGPALRSWRQGAARRVNFRNTRCNYSDFMQVDFRYPTGYANRRPEVAAHANGITNAELSALRPRYSGDGAWSIQGGGDGTTLVISTAPYGAGAYPAYGANPGDTILISAGYHFGYDFREWTVLEGGDDIVIADPTSPETYFIMPDPATSVVLLAGWDAFYNVTVNNSFAGALSGAGTYEIGERVTVFAGTRAGGWFFDGWSGSDVFLLADRNAAITYFIMPARDVSFNANWREIPAANVNWPIHITGIRNDTVITNHAEGAIVAGHVAASGAAGPWGVNGTPAAERTVMNIPVNYPGANLTLIAKTGHHGHMADNDRAMQFSVDQFGNFTSTNPHAVFSQNPPSNQVYISYGNPATTPDGSEFLFPPAPGHIPWEPPLERFDLTVIDSFATTPELAGEGRFPEGLSVAINAGVRENYVFDRWDVTGISPDALADRFNPVTTFTMPNAPVTVTAIWIEGQREQPDVDWPVQFSAFFGDRLHEVATPIMDPDRPERIQRNTGTTPGYIVWVNPNQEVGSVGLQTRSIRFVPDQTAMFYSTTNIVQIVVLAGEGDIGIPTASAIWHGEPLSASAISGGSPEGTWSWLDGAQLPGIGANQPFEAVFTPHDAGNIDWSEHLPTGWTWHEPSGTVRGTIPVTVNDPADIVTVISEGAGSSGSGTFATGATVHINAGTAPRWYQNFSHWEVTEGGPLADLDPYSPVASFTKPNHAVILTAVFADLPAFNITVNGGHPGTASSNRPGAPPNRTNAGYTVTINAGAFGQYTFAGWTVTSGNATLADPSAVQTTFTMPEGDVVLQANWTQRYTVTINEGHGGAESGAGIHNVGDRVVVFAGNRGDDYFFDGWTVSGTPVTLANSDAAITYFTMPAGNVTLTATWREELVVGVPSLPMEFRAIVNDPVYVRGTWFDGHFTGGGTESYRIDETAPVMRPDDATRMLISRNVTAAQNFTLRVGNGESRDHTGDGRAHGAGRVIHVSVTAAPTVNVVANAFSSDWGWQVSQNQNTGNGQVSHDRSIPGVTFISYGASIPDGHIEGPFRASDPAETFTVTVNGARGVSAALSGAGSFPAGQTVAINAGTQPGYEFSHWAVVIGGVTIAQINNAITTFEMPAGDVTVLAHWDDVTIGLDPSSAVISNGNLSQAVAVTGTASGNIAVSYTLPDALQNYVTVTWTAGTPTVTISGIRPTVQGRNISGNFDIAVTRNGVTANLPVEVNLTSTWADILDFSPEYVEVNDQNLTATVDMTGAATGNIDVSYTIPAALLNYVEMDWTATTPSVTVTATRPSTNVPSVVGYFYVYVTRQDTTESFRVDVNLTTTWYPTVEFNPASVSLTDANAGTGQVVNVIGGATGDISANYTIPAAMQSFVSISVSQGANPTVTVTGTRPTTDVEPVIGHFYVEVTRQGVSESFRVDVNLTSAYTPHLDHPDVIIHQIHAGGSVDSNALSHSFIELYNLSDESVYLGNFSLQVQNSAGIAAATPVPWNVLPLSELPTELRTIQPMHSLLIVSSQGVWTGAATARRQIEAYDFAWDQVFDNRSFAVALVSDHAALPPANAAGDNRVIDLVGGRNAAADRLDNYFGAPTRVSRSEAPRRINFQNTQNNAADFEGTRPLDSYPLGNWDVTFPRYSGDGAWPADVTPTAVTVTAAGGAETVVQGATLQFSAVVGPRGASQAVGWSINPPVDGASIGDAGLLAVDASVPEGTPITVVATAYGTDVFGTETVTVTPAVQRSDVVLAEIATTVHTQSLRFMHVDATGGLFQSVSSLQAFSNNAPVEIRGENTPFNFRNQENLVHPQLVDVDGREDFPNLDAAGIADNVGGRGWRGVGTGSLDSGVTIETASAWQVRFSTEGFNNIRFSAQQRSTSSGPDAFALAYRIGSDGEWMHITGSERSIFRGGNGNITDYENPASHSFTDFLLPAAVNDQPVVYLRVYARDLTIDRRLNGNTSINNIMITGENEGDTPPETVTVTAADDATTVERGATLQFGAVVGPTGASQAVEWSIYPTVDGASISNTGLLTVDASVPEDTSITVRATATGTDVFGEAAVIVTAVGPCVECGDNDVCCATCGNECTEYPNCDCGVHALLPGSAIAVPATEANVTHNTITVYPAELASNTGQTIEYAISTSGTVAPTTGWQAGLFFDGRDPGTQHFVWSRSAANATHNAGEPMASEGITTLNLGIELTGIEPPANVSNVLHGAEATAEGLGLPAQVRLNLADSTYRMVYVTWNVAASNYDPAITAEQNFTVLGIFDLPSGIINTATHPLEVSINVTVLARSISVLLGDVNGDGVVDMADAFLLALYLANPGSVDIIRANADVSGRGIVDEYDLNLLRQYLARLILSFPAAN